MRLQCWQEFWSQLIFLPLYPASVSITAIDAGFPDLITLLAQGKRVTLIENECPTANTDDGIRHHRMGFGATPFFV